MAAITSCGCYLPIGRLSRKEAAAAWGNRGSGETSVMAVDEDEITMGLEAAVSCLERAGRDKQPDAVSFASGVLPAGERNPAALVSYALGLAKNTFCSNFSGSCLAGMEALFAACALVKTEEFGSILVIVSEGSRKAEPGTRRESSFGAGAVALLIEKEGPVKILDRFYQAGCFPDVWSNHSGFVYEADYNFAKRQGYGEQLAQAIISLFGGNSLEPFDYIAYAQPDDAMTRQLLKNLKADREKTAPGYYYNKLGDLGAASALFSLLMVLEGGKPGDRVLTVAYSAGSSAFMSLELGSGITGLMADNSHTPGAQIAKGNPVSYLRYLQLKDILQCH